MKNEKKLYVLRATLKNETGNGAQSERFENDEKFETLEEAKQSLANFDEDCSGIVDSDVNENVSLFDLEKKEGIEYDVLNVSIFAVEMEDGEMIEGHVVPGDGCERTFVVEIDK